MNDVKGDKVGLQIRDQRECECALWLLRQYYPIVYIRVVNDTGLSTSTATDPYSLKSAIISALGEYFTYGSNNDEERMQGYIKISNKLVNSFLDISDFDWLHNKLACYWMWFQLRFSNLFTAKHINELLNAQKRSTDDLFLHFFSRILTSHSEYLTLELPGLVDTHDKRYSVILKYFERLPISRRVKLSILRHYKNSFMQLTKRKRELYLPIKSENRVMCEHAWCYIQKDKKIMGNANLMLPTLAIDSCYFKMISAEKTHEIFLAAQVLHLVLNKTDDERKLSKKRYIKAWKSKVTRFNKKKGKSVETFAKETEIKSNSFSYKSHDCEKRKIADGRFIISSEKMYSPPKPISVKDEQPSHILDRKTGSLGTQQKKNNQHPSEEDIGGSFDTDIPW